jgi:hypothetical protein
MTKEKTNKSMRRTILSLLTLLALGSTIVSCNNYETYGDKKDKERRAISAFIADSAFTIIDEDQFRQQNYTTSTTKGNNQFVYLNNSGVYMQIVRKGCGTPLQDNERTDLLVRFLEVALFDTAAVFNDARPYSVDVMSITRAGSTYTASFSEGIMRSTYGESVPSGWLVPFNYINVGRPRTADDEIAKVRLIVPHTQGHTIAASYVYPYYYEITFERKIDTVN